MSVLQDANVLLLCQSTSRAGAVMVGETPRVTNGSLVDVSLSCLLWSCVSTGEYKWVCGIFPLVGCLDQSQLGTGGGVTWEQEF